MFIRYITLIFVQTTKSVNTCISSRKKPELASIPFYPTMGMAQLISPQVFCKACATSWVHRSTYAFL